MRRNLTRHLPMMLTILVVGLAGCAAHPDPIIDMKGVDPDALAQDWEECEAYTDEIILAKGVARGDRKSVV